MLAAALADGSAARTCAFEVFARRLPHGRRYGVVAGTGRLLEALRHFRFGEPELAVVAGFLDERTLNWLREYRFTGRSSTTTVPSPRRRPAWSRPPTAAG
ncbi:nicotinate phosphoribosyltransferase [Mycobacteroides abscessus subsp. abscessus]|nr:nicotinate phosphoribosyltransferase [Mycobacteroides abscessus subsp. abscessus]